MNTDNSPVSTVENVARNSPSIIKLRDSQQHPQLNAGQNLPTTYGKVRIETHHQNASLTSSGDATEWGYISSNIQQLYLHMITTNKNRLRVSARF